MHCSHTSFGHIADFGSMGLQEFYNLRVVGGLNNINARVGDFDLGFDLFVDVKRASSVGDWMITSGFLPSANRVTIIDICETIAARTAEFWEAVKVEMPLERLVTRRSISICFCKIDFRSST